jgi:hypothetical protein
MKLKVDFIFRDVSSDYNLSYKNIGFEKLRIIYSFLMIKVILSSPQYHILLNKCKLVLQLTLQNECFITYFIVY